MSVFQVNDKSNKTIIREMDESNKKLMDGKKKQYASNLDAITRDNYNILVGIPQISFDYTITKRDCPQCGKHLMDGGQRVCDICYDLNHGIKHDCYCEYHQQIQTKKIFKIKHKLQTYAEYVCKVWATMKSMPGVTNDTY